MKKCYIVAAIFVAMALVFTGCQKKEASSASSGGSAPVTISVLNYLDLTAANAADSIEAIWGGFEKAYPNIKVVREDLYNEPFHQKLLAYSTSNNLPDVVYCWPAGRSAYLADAGQLKDLSTIPGWADFAKNLIPAATNVSAIQGGKQYMIPSTVTSSTAFYINTATLAKYNLKPATSYADLVSQVKTLKAAGMQTPLAMDNKDDWVMESCLYSLIAGRYAGATWTSDLLSGKLKWTDPSMMAGLNFVKQLYDDGVIAKDSLNSTYGTARQMFATGQSAYMIDGDWAAGSFATDKTTGQALIPVDQQKNVIITVFPALPNEVLQNSTATVLGTGYAMSAKLQNGTPEQQAAWTLLQYLFSKDVQTYNVSTGSIGTPVNTTVDMASINSQRDPILATQGAFDADCGGKYPATPVEDDKFSGNTNTVLNNGLQQIGLGTMTPQQVAEATQKAFDEQYMSK
ncbi:MAG: extracellular solute-binding protein [Spirochaetaceae bacterium]|jgi:raffinose/stachyose/melibiose transport system substrate-binding protein|nr:extracellular solute-binding protein [Spirochaetaceae bacterium]